MQGVDRRQKPGTVVLLLHTLLWVWTDAIKPVPRIDGRPRSSVTLQENITRQFRCQLEGWDLRAPHRLTWYLNGERQSRTSPGASEVLSGDGRPNSTFSLHSKRWDRELVCTASNPREGRSYNATVLLNVQFQPEILQVNAHYSETSDPGLSLVLFALVRSNPPATITFVDQAGQLVANTSDFLILDSRSYPWMTNHTLRVTLSSLAGNVSMNASNSVGTVQSNFTLAEFLQSRVELPVLGILTGGIVGFVTLLVLTLLVLCLLHKNKGKAVEEPVEILLTKRSESPRRQRSIVCLPRENMSLPSNMQLNDTLTLCTGRVDGRPNPEEEDLSAAYAARGFARYPMVGYIYKVNSVSSDEIWL